MPLSPSTASPSAAVPIPAGHPRVIGEYTPVWEVGTGLRTAIAPGRYTVSCCETRGTEEFVLLDDRYWVERRRLEGCADA